MIVTAPAGDLNALLDAVGGLMLPQALSESLWLEGLQAIFPVPSAVAAAPDHSSTFTCIICDETKPQTQRAILDGCTCATTSCNDCTRDAVRLAETAKQIDHCPTLCGAPLTRRGLERLGMPPDEVNQRSTRVMRGRLATLPDWRTCQTADCNGGRQVPDDDCSFSCQFCNTVNHGNSRTDKVVLRKLFEGFTAFPDAVMEDGDGLLRECYHCGIPTEKEAGCQHMACTSCGEDWHFVNGPYRGDTEYHGDSVQRFRPRRNGILGRLGFYAEIPAGQLSHANQQLLCKRASDWRRNGLPADVAMNALDAEEPDSVSDGVSYRSSIDSSADEADEYESDWSSQQEQYFTEDEDSDA